MELTWLIARKLPYKMSQSRKRHIRERLKNVEHTLDVLNSVGMPLKALVYQVYHMHTHSELG